MKKSGLLLLSAILISTTFARNHSDTRDSLRMELERVNDALEKAEQQKKDRELAESAAKIDEAIVQIDEAKKDSSANLTTLEEAKKLLSRINFRITNGEQNGFGGSGGIHGGVTYFNMKPVKEVLLRELRMSGTKSPIYGTGLENSFSNREVIGMLGGIGMGGIGNGIRIGGAGIGGNHDFSVNKGDSIFTLNVDVSYGGFLIAKQYTIEKHNITVTGLVGAGSTEMKIYAGTHGGSSGLVQNQMNNNWEYGKGDEISSRKSKFFVTDISATYTYSFLRWLHAGVGLGAFMQYSGKGFNGSDDYAAINPEAQFRILFGRLG